MAVTATCIGFVSVKPGGHGRGANATMLTALDSWLCATGPYVDEGWAGLTASKWLFLSTGWNPAWEIT